MVKAEIKTKGMHCRSCEMLIKDALEELPGVNNVEVSHIRNLVVVDFDETKVTKKEITEIIRQEGYEVK